MQSMALFLLLIYALYWHCSFCFAKLDKRGKNSVRGAEQYMLFKENLLQALSIQIDLIALLHGYN